MGKLIRAVGQSRTFIALEDFMADYGLCIAAFCLGVILVYALWFRRHPEDFYGFYGFEESEQEVAIEEIDHAHE